MLQLMVREDSILVLKGFIFILVFVSCSVCAIFGFDCATGKKDGLTKLRLPCLWFSWGHQVAVTYFGSLFLRNIFIFFYLWEISLIHWRPSLFKWGHWWPSVISPNPFNFVLPTKWHVPLISHCCHGHPIPIATKGLHRLTGRDVLRVNTHIRKQPLAMLKPSRSLWIIKGLVCFPPLTVMASNEIQ